ncbi:hypothetical protein SK128_012202, partial [Halocaridina rubra]
VDTSLAESTLKTMDAETGAVTPPNFVSKRFVHFTCDNTDINDNISYGKNSFHATQIAGWQRSQSGHRTEESSTFPKHESESSQGHLSTFTCCSGDRKTRTRATEGINKEWCNESNDDNPSAAQAIAKDMAFFLK